MFFYTDVKNKLVWGWSAKCGCSHIKNLILNYENDVNSLLHCEKKFSNSLPNNIQNYDIIIVLRNPFKRLVSGFCDKYSPNGELRSSWKGKQISFSRFVNDLIKNSKNYDTHFRGQTRNKFDYKIYESKSLKVFDLENIDYKYIEDKIRMKIPQEVKNKKIFYNHLKFRIQNLIKDEHIERPVYDLDIVEYIYYKVDLKYFYNKELIEKVYSFYEDDFKFAELNNINYEAPKI